MYNLTTKYINSKLTILTMDISGVFLFVMT